MMEKQVLMFVVLCLCVVSVSASSTSAKEIWSWQVIKLDNNFSVDITNKFNQSTDIYLLSDIAVQKETWDDKLGRWIVTQSASITDISATKNIYNSPIATAKSTGVINKTDYKYDYLTKRLTRTIKYGYAYKTNKETYLKFGENSTIVNWVNQTGGDAYYGWHTGSDLNDPENFGPPADVYTQYTTAQKEIVSNYTDDYVKSSGSGIGGADCSYPARVGSTSNCAIEGITTCNSYFQYTGTSASSCMWVSGPNICVPATPCARYPFHKFVFNATKSGATNVNFLFGMKENGIDPPTTNTNVYLYLRNYSSTSVESYVYLKNIGSVTCYNVTFCNLTYSTTNINNYINASGQITAYIMNANTWNLHVYYAEVNVTYSDNCWTKTGTGRGSILFIPKGCLYQLLKGVSSWF